MRRRDRDGRGSVLGCALRWGATMKLLQTLGTGTGYLKAGFLGFAKSGKSYTATLLACGVRAHFGLPGPIVMFDTEAGSEYIAALVRRMSGAELVGVRSRSFSDLMAAAKEAQELGAAVLLVDSITHPWRELCDAYLARVNAARERKGQQSRTRLEFQDWANIKAQWAPWTDWYLNSPMHVIICGRAGYEYDFQDREDSPGRDLVKTGVKMKVEGEFGFEPSLLVEMERVMQMDGTKRLIHRATVLGDRFAILDGETCDNPSFEFFKPHVSALIPGTHAPVDTAVKTQAGVSDEGDVEWQQERRVRTIICEEIEGELVRRWPGQTKEERQAKLSAIEDAFGTRSWTRIQSLQVEALRAGLAKIRSDRPEPTARAGETEAASALNERYSPQGEAK
jgi:hypothetical protein